MPQHYTSEFKKKIIRLHEDEGRTYKSIAAEYGISKSSIYRWCSEFRVECQTILIMKKYYDNMSENLKLKKEIKALRKENLFLKKNSGILRKGIQLKTHRLIDRYYTEFGVK